MTCTPALCRALPLLGLLALERTSEAADGSVTWATATSSPVAIAEAPRDPLARTALSRCGEGEAGLLQAAKQIVASKLLGLPMLDADAIAAAQRVEGEPHPWARAWAASAKTLAPEATLRSLDAWLSESRYPRLRRCGVASAIAADGTQVLAIVAVDALADISPLPIRGRTGQWLEVEARLRVPVSGGSVIVLGPSGAPHPVPTWFDGRSLHARFALDRPGEFSVQVVASTDGGPRPVLEARVFADVDPFVALQDDATRGASGEDADASGSDDDDLRRMLSAARAAAGESPLVRDTRLDAISRAHAQHMASSQDLAHDAGDGDPSERMRAAGLEARTSGENVAHAATVALAHRALWASPSHRANLLRRDFERIGIAVARDGRGDAWVVETFAGGTR